MRAAISKYFFARLQKDMRPPQAPVAANGKGSFVACTCSNGDDCGGNNMTVYFDSVAGNAQVRLRSEGSDGKVQDLLLVNGEARPVPINGCGIGERNPFASLRGLAGNEGGTGACRAKRKKVGTGFASGHATKQRLEHHADSKENHLDLTAGQISAADRIKLI
jgi:hypothetical protein